MIRSILIFLVFAAAAARPHPHEQEGPDVWDTIFHNSNLEVFSLALRVANMEPPTTEATVFAPSDDAFLKVPEAALNALFNSPSTLRRFINLHIVPHKTVYGNDAIWKWMETNLGAPGAVWGQEADAGAAVKIKGIFKAGALCILGPNYDLKNHWNVATVTENDLVASNGVVHVIDTVLYPDDLRICEQDDECFEGEICEPVGMNELDNCAERGACFGNLGAVQSKIKALSSVPGDADDCPCLKHCEACHGKEAMCKEDHDCCDGLLCDEGLCAECRDLGNECDPEEETTSCCSGTTCDGNTKTCCAGINQECMHHADCCSGYYCDETTWLCHAAGSCPEALMGDKPTGIYPLSQFATPWDPDRDDTRTGIVGVQDTRCLRDTSGAKDHGKDRIWTLWTSFSQLESEQFDIGWVQTEGTGTAELRKKEAYAWGFDFESSALLFNQNQWLASSCQGLEEFTPGDSDFPTTMLLNAKAAFSDTSCSSACIGVDIMDGYKGYGDTGFGDGLLANDPSTSAVSIADPLNEGTCYPVAIWNSVFKNENSWLGFTLEEPPLQIGGSDCQGTDYQSALSSLSLTTSGDITLGGATNIQANYKCGNEPHSLTTWWTGSWSDASCVDKANGAPCGPKGLDRCINTACISTRCEFSNFFRGAQVVGPAEVPCTTDDWAFIGRTGRCYYDSTGAPQCGEILTDCDDDGADAGHPCNLKRSGGDLMGWCQIDGFEPLTGASATYDCYPAVRDCGGYAQGTRCTYAGANRNELGFCTGTGATGAGYNTCATITPCTGVDDFATYDANGIAEGTTTNFAAPLQGPGNRACMLATGCDTEIQDATGNEWGLLSEETELRYGYCTANGCVPAATTAAALTALGTPCPPPVPA